MKKVIITLSMLFSYQANALVIDSMLTTSDDHGNGVYTLTNDKDGTSFISGTISKLVVNDKGEIDRIDYTKDNLSSWDLTITNPKLILESGRTKQVGVRSLCGTECNFEKDRVYQITFSPVPYVPEDEKQAEPNLTINFGYAPLFIIPAKESHVSVNMTYKGDAIHVENNGNTYVRFMVSKCTKELTTECKKAYTALSGRVKDFKLPAYLQDKKIELMMVNHDETYRQKFSLNLNQKKHLGN